MKNSNKNRKPAVAGQFYPSSPTRLREDIIRYLSEAKPKKISNVQSVISPHAGYVFSGKIAASGFNQIDEEMDYKRVFLLASSHHYHFDGAAVYCDGDFEMPYGSETVDTELGRKLVEDYPHLFTDNPAPHIKEHSIEVQLPFLHYKLPAGYKIVPIVIAASEPETCAEIALAVKPYFTKENLFVVSTDFSHYPGYEDAKAVDNATASAILSNHPQALLDVLDKNKLRKVPHLLTSLCGWTSVLTLLYITQNKDFAYHEIDYCNSGDEKMYGERNEVVGYWAIAVARTEEKVHDKEFSLSEEDKTALLDVARRTIENLFDKTILLPDLKQCTEAIYAPCGAFVTLHRHGKLRGCIGMIVSEEPLVETIRDMAVSAARKDYRFHPVQKNELEDLDIEISVLSPLKRVGDISEIELGKHGIYMVKGRSSGVFLPQVADETGWNLEEFLGHCARDKAGIEWDGWKQADIYTFTATVFKEAKR